MIISRVTKFNICCKNYLAQFDEMEPLLWTSSTNSELSNQITPNLVVYTCLTLHQVGQALQTNLEV